MGTARIMDPSQTLIFPALGPIYQCLAPWAEAALRAVVGLWLVPHALRNTFGFFPTTGVRARNLAHATHCRAAPGARTVHAPRGLRDPDVSRGHEFRALARRKILLESAR